MEMKLREEKGKGGFGDNVPARSCRIQTVS